MRETLDFSAGFCYMMRVACDARQPCQTAFGMNAAARLQTAILADCRGAQ
jgi:hypothetical protein